MQGDERGKYHCRRISGDTQHSCSRPEHGSDWVTAASHWSAPERGGRQFLLMESLRIPKHKQPVFKNILNMPLTSFRL